MNSAAKAYISIGLDVISIVSAIVIPDARRRYFHVRIYLTSNGCSLLTLTTLSAV